jgi:hypothetical protein
MIAGLAGGLAQFFLPTHLLAVVALGLLAGRGARLPSHLAGLALGLVIGSVAIASAVREMPAAMALLALAVACGIALALAWTPPALVADIGALTVGVALALNAPPQALTIPVAVAEQIGTGVAALLTFGLVAVGARQATRPWQQIGLRIAGSWIAASAILVLALRLAR